MASLGTITLTGESGSTYNFNIYDRTAKFQAFGAVYVMSRKTDKGTYSIIYIGETGDLSKRPLNHHKTDCFDKRKADKLLIRSAPDAKRRLADETDLIRHYQPPCNDQ